MKLEGIRKIFVLGDLHLGIRNNSLEWSEIQSNFLINHFLEQVDKEGFDPEQDILVQVGDWNHVRESTNVRIYKLSLHIAKILTQKFKRGVYVILGNHDVYYKDRTDTHSLEGFDKIYDNFHVFTKPESISINSHKFLMLPWIESLAEIKAQIQNHKSAKYVFCHTDFKGFNFNKVQSLEHGLEHEDIASFTKIYSGHIHIRQEKGNVLYVGTPYEMDRGDRGNVKGFYVLDVNNNKIKEKFIENDYSPKHVKFDAFDLLNLTTEEIRSLFSNNFVDVSIDVDFSQKFPLSQFTDLIEGFGHRRIEFFTYSKNQIKDRSEVEQEADYSYNIFTILDEHINRINLPASQSVRLVEKFKEIYDQLKNTKQYD